MFRGKESSNRIKLSRLVQELLKLGVLGSLRLWGGGRWVGGCLGVSGGMGGCPHMHAHARTRTHTHTHTCIELQMAASMEASMFTMFNMHVRACVRACACVCMRTCMGHPPTHSYLPPPPSTHLPPPRGVDPRNHLKFDNTSTYQDISIPFKDLKSVKNSPPMGGCVVWWVGGWLGGLMGGVRSNH